MNSDLHAPQSIYRRQLAESLTWWLGWQVYGKERKRCTEEDVENRRKRSQRKNSNPFDFFFRT